MKSIVEEPPTSVKGRRSLLDPLAAEQSEDMTSPSTKSAPPHPHADTTLSRTLSLPLLVFYGLGVTIGAGIFALVGEILGLAGDQAPLAFLVAGIIAGFTGISYMALVAEYPRAGGEAVYVSRGIGDRAGMAAGLGVVITGIVSSAVVAIAFAGYVTTLLPVSETVAAVGIIALLTLVAWWGIRESVALAALVTVLELGTLLVVIGFGLGSDGLTAQAIGDGFNVFADGAIGPVVAGAGIAFFAFIGFEDIANMAEETIDPRTTAPKAILFTLIITVVAYVGLAMIAASLADRSAITESNAPMSVIFEQVSGLDASAISTIASFAMVNGILVQIVMASRVLYGMANEGQLPTVLGTVSVRHHTPTFATGFVGATIVLLTVSFPLVQLARVTSVLTLGVFTLVNIALIRLALRDVDSPLRKWLLNAVLGAIAAAALGTWQVIDLVG